jgi:hypothetical protein
VLECPLEGQGSPEGAIKMARRPRTPPITPGAPRGAAGRPPRPNVVHTSVYLPKAVHESLREAAFHERCKIHDIILEGINAALKKRRYPSIDDLKAGKKR